MINCYVILQARPSKPYVLYFFPHVSQTWIISSSLFCLCILCQGCTMFSLWPLATPQTLHLYSFSLLWTLWKCILRYCLDGVLYSHMRHLYGGQKTRFSIVLQSPPFVIHWLIESKKMVTCHVSPVACHLSHVITRIGASTEKIIENTKTPKRLEMEARQADYIIPKKKRWKYANTLICIFSVWPLPKVENWFRKQIWNENVYISILNFFLKSFGQYLKKSKMDFSLYFQKLIWPG